MCTVQGTNERKALPVLFVFFFSSLKEVGKWVSLIFIYSQHHLNPMRYGVDKSTATVYD